MDAIFATPKDCSKLVNGFTLWKVVFLLLYKEWKPSQWFVCVCLFFFCFALFFQFFPIGCKQTIRLLPRNTKRKTYTILKSAKHVRHCCAFVNAFPNEWLLMTLIMMIITIIITVINIKKKHTKKEDTKRAEQKAGREWATVTLRLGFLKPAITRGTNIHLAVSVRIWRPWKKKNSTLSRYLQEARHWI